MSVSTKAMYVNKFLRAYPEEFSVKEFIKYMSYVGCDISKEEASEIIDASPYLFQLENGRYVTRAGVFSDRYFSVALSKEECDNQCFMPGHRCLPFVDQEVMSWSLTFFWGSNILNHKVVEFSKEFALEHFSLYGEEYEAQYIANDPGMEKFQLAEHDFELPMKVYLKSVDLAPLFTRYKIEPGDRLLLRVENWDEGIIAIEPLLRERGEVLELTNDDLERNRWYKNLEKYMLDFFDRMGPCSSIEEQIADVFFEHKDELCIKNCGSVEEFMKKTKAVSVELFGVETRLWHAGKTVPAIGLWNSEDREEEAAKTNLIYTVPDYVMDEYIKDYAFLKKNKIDDLIDGIFPKSCFLPDDYKDALLLHIKNRNDIILKSYNWFADHQLGDLRHKALLLYTRISTLVYEIDRTGGKFKNYPQQELVILIQLYTHLTKLIETIAFDGSSIVNDTETISVSLDGMEFNFDDIEPELRNAVIASKKREFTVID